MDFSKIKRESLRLLMQLSVNAPFLFSSSFRGGVKKRWNMMQYEEGRSVAAPPRSWRENAVMLDLSMTSGFGETVHPDVLYIPDGFGAEKWRYLMAVTPFPKAIVYFENPEFLVSYDGISWRLPQGGKSPVAAPPSDWTGYNSDPALFYEDGEVFLFYREVREEKNFLLVTLFVTSSRDGAEWSAPKTLKAVKTPTNRAGILMSPAVLKVGGRYFVWYVDEENGEYKMKRAECPGLSSLTDVADAALDGMPDGFSLWHIDMAEDGGRLLMAFCAKNDAGRHSIFFAESSDAGLSWHVINGKRLAPISGAGEESLYKAALVKDAESRQWKLYYSFKDTGGHWYTLMEEIKL